jgi:hypothetical protein
LSARILQHVRTHNLRPLLRAPAKGRGAPARAVGRGGVTETPLGPIEIPPPIGLLALKPLGPLETEPKGPLMVPVGAMPGIPGIGGLGRGGWYDGPLGPRPIEAPFGADTCTPFGPALMAPRGPLTETGAPTCGAARMAVAKARRDSGEKRMLLDWGMGDGIWAGAR